MSRFRLERKHLSRAGRRAVDDYVTRMLRRDGWLAPDETFTAKDFAVTVDLAQIVIDPGDDDEIRIDG